MLLTIQETADRLRVKPRAEVQAVLRHATIAQTMVYAHLAPENARRAVEALSDFGKH